MTDIRPPYSPLTMSAPGTPQTMDEARERAVRLLTDGFAYDVITVEEFEWRLGQMSSAGSPQAIDALVADLGMPLHAVATGTPRPPAMLPSEGRILGIMSETRRVGPWRVPQQLRVKAIMSDTKIDLRYAAIPLGCTIHVTAVMAAVTFVVAPGMIVDFDVSAFMGAAGNDRRAVGTDGYALPRVRIHGSAIMAEVRVRVRELGY